MVERVPTQALQPTYLPPLRCGKSMAELGRVRLDRWEVMSTPQLESSV